MKAPTASPAKPLLKKTRAIKDCATNDWSIEFEFLQPDGTKGRALVTGDDAENVGSLRRNLNQKGARLPRNAEERKALLEGAIAADAKKVVHQLANSGWQIGGPPPWMSVGTKLIGAPDGVIEYAPPAFIAQSRAKHFAESGTLEEWKSKVAAIAEHSTSITIGIAAAFAAPLLRVAGMQNFALHVFGPSRAGKTTTLLCSTSVYAFGQETRLPNWSSTGLRILESACAFGDLVLPLNEVGAKRGPRKRAYEGLRDLYAQYAEGSDRERHSSWQGGKSAVPKPFHGICISTAEHSVAEYAAWADQSRDAGELFRAMDVMAVREEKATVLDLAPDTLDQRACLTQLHNDLKVCYGVAFEPYVEFLRTLDAAGKLQSRVKALIAAFVAKMPGAQSDGIAQQIATNFGALYAGALLGIEAGVLPWTREHVQQTHRTAFVEAFERCQIGDPLKMGLDNLKTNLRDKIVELKPGSTFGTKDHAGYWELDGGEKIVVVHARQFRSWFGGDGQFRLVLEWLCRQGYLKHAKGATKGILVGEDFDGVTLRWPRGIMVRSFSFADPDAGPQADASELPSPAPKEAMADEGRAVRIRRSLRRNAGLKQAAKRKPIKPLWDDYPFLADGPKTLRKPGRR